MLPESIQTIFLISISFITFFTSNVFSQSPSYLDSLDGKFALQFQINDNFNLSSFQGTTLSGKYHFSCRDAVRLGLSIELDESDGETSSNRLDTVTVDTYKMDRNNFGITINTQYIRYFRGTENISFYGGAGPFVNYNTSTSTGEVKLGENIDKYESTSDSYTIGLDLLFGVEWWFHKYMSLSAEYGLKFMYRSSEGTNEIGIVKREITNNNFRITANSINFGLSVYF